ncbi:uncharacterized protein TrAtP1_008517 [Trichoderma atroviride]|uniref:uncharacterized protein n=1 Tax=Hypocrea atroviridis TaxID=63577 RepID=UPI003323CAAF|nr:hypothetical protein TrAtP1_008517 [Trichoderma atroviride]
MGINHKLERARHVKERTRKGIDAMSIYVSLIDMLAVWNGIKGVGSSKRGNGVEPDRQSDDGIYGNISRKCNLFLRQSVNANSPIQLDSYRG